MAKIKLQGIKKLNKIVTKAFMPFGIENVYLHEEFEYRFEKNEIGFDVVAKKSDEWFNDFVEQTFGYIVPNTFIISILHEIGHAETADFIEDDTYIECIIKKDRITKALATADEETEKALEFEYFALPDELEATTWAVEYAKEHEQELAEIWEDIKNGLNEFVENNEKTLTRIIAHNWCY